MLRGLFLLAISSVGSASPSAPPAASSLKTDIEWSIAHEGCPAYRRDGQAPAELLLASELRVCFLKVQEHNRLVYSEIEKAPDEDLINATREAVRAIPEDYKLRDSVDWVMVHEGLSEQLKALAKENRTLEIRAIYEERQQHNPNARHLLSALSDSEVKQMILADSIIISVTPSVSKAALEDIARATQPMRFVADRPISLTDLAQQKYGTSRLDVTDLISRMNKGVIPDPLGDGSRMIQPGTSLSLPTLPRFGKTVTVVADRNTKLVDIARPWYTTLGDSELQEIINRNPTVLTLSSGVVPQGARLLLPDVSISDRLAIKQDVSVTVLTKRLQKYSAVLVGSVPKMAENEKPVKVDAAMLQSTSNVSLVNLADNWYGHAIQADQLSTPDLHFLAPTLIAVIDSGVDTQQPDLRGLFWRNHIDSSNTSDYTYWPQNAIGWDYVNESPDPTDEDPDSHGTHVSGLASGVNLARFYPDFAAAHLDQYFQIMSLKVSAADNTFDSSHIDNAIGGARAHGARLFNLSMKAPYLDSLNRMLRDIVVASTTLFVISAGNGRQFSTLGSCDDCVNLDKDKSFNRTFRDLDEVILVAAVGPNSTLAYFSNRGSGTIDIAAPGVQIQSTVYRKDDQSPKYGYLSGTSQAAPLVTFTAASIMSLKPGLNASEVKRRILETCDWKEELASFVRNGCMLNYAKAVLVNEDVIEMKDHILLHGQMAPYQQFVVRDKDGSQSVLTADNDGMRRIWFTSKDLVIRMQATGSANKSFPEMLTDKVTITTKKCPPEFVNGTACDIPVKNIQDIVFHLRQ